MKKFIVLLATVVLGCNLLNAQVAPKYRELKKTYDPREYVKMSTDPYSPIWAGAASFLMPGLGQMVCDEVGRGIAFFAGEMALASATATFGYAAEYNETCAVLCIVSAIATIAVDIWSIVDATHVAKVKNMYRQDVLAKGTSLSLYPSVKYAPGSNFAPGLTLAVNF